MPRIDKTPPSDSKASAAKGSKPKPSAARSKADADLLTLTIDATNGRVVSLERVEAGGARHALSAEERARLVKAQAAPPLESLVEQAFEAGIECVLGGNGKEPRESKADGALSRMLLQSLIEHSNAKHLIESETINRSIVGTLIGQAAGGPSASRDRIKEGELQ